ncbi:MAG: hypothetical protein ABFS86_16085, partial [Planctomycetota bacterium]
MQRPLLITLIVPTFLILAASNALAVDPAVENIVKTMDEKAREGKADEVLADAKARVARADTAANRYLLGRAYGLAREYEKARVEFERVLERDIRSPLGYHGLGAYFFSKRDVEAAEKNFRK